MDTFIGIVITGMVATVVMDVWGFVRQPLLGVAPPNYALVGRWLAHMRHGTFRHTAIAKSPSLHGELTELRLGWLIHYLTGIAFAALLVSIVGKAWLSAPTLLPALVVGIATVAAPFLLMQPGMGAGIASAKTPRPNAARLQSLITHSVFGIGLYIGAWAARSLYLTFL